MSKQSWKGSTLLNPEPPVLVSCGGLDKPNLITIGWTGTICTQPSMVSISVRPERYSHQLIREDVYKRQLPWRSAATLHARTPPPPEALGGVFVLHFLSLHSSLSILVPASS